MNVWLLETHNQFLLVMMALTSLISFLAGHRLGEREGYEDGVRTLAKTMKLSQVRLRLEFEDEDKC